MNIKRTQVWFDKSRLKRKKHTGKSWQFLVDIGLEYQESQIAKGLAVPSKEHRRTKDFQKQIAGEKL